MCMASMLMSFAELDLTQLVRAECNNRLSLLCTRLLAGNEYLPSLEMRGSF